MNKVKSNPLHLYSSRGGELGKTLLKKIPIAAAGVLLFAAALIFTGCSNGSDSGGTPPTPPVPGSFAVTFSVDGGNGTLKAKADGIPETNVSPITVE